MKKKTTTFRVSNELHSQVRQMVDANCLQFSGWLTKVVIANMQAIGLADKEGRPIKQDYAPLKEKRRKSPYRGRKKSIGWSPPPEICQALHEYARTTACDAANVSELLTTWLEAEIKKMYPPTLPVNRFQRQRQIAAQ